MEVDAEVPLTWGHDDDDRALVDLLELIDSSHGDLSLGAPMEVTSTDGTPTTPPTPQLASSPSQQDRDCQLRARSKAPPKRLPKDELEYLRGKVDELEAQLAALRSRSTVKAEPGSGTPEQVDQAFSAASVWETIALHQMDAKRKAEVENVRLREMLEGQLRVAHNLERVLRKRPIRQAESILKPKRLCTAEPADTSQHDQLLANATARLAKVREVVKIDMDETPPSSPFNNLTVDHNGKAMLSMESYQEERVLPFDATAICDAYWKCFSMEMQFPNGQYTPIATTKDSIKARFAVTYSMRRSEVLVMFNFAMKRSIQDDCCLFTWETVSDEDSDHVFGGFSSLKVSDEGYGLIKRCASSTDENPASLLKSSARIDVEFVMQSLRQQDQVGVLTDVLLDSYSRAIGVINQTTENLLMTAAIGLT